MEQVKPITEDMIGWLESLLDIDPDYWEESDFDDVIKVLPALIKGAKRLLYSECANDLDISFMGDGKPWVFYDEALIARMDAGLEAKELRELVKDALIETSGLHDIIAMPSEPSEKALIKLLERAKDLGIEIK